MTRGSYSKSLAQAMGYCITLCWLLAGISFSQIDAAHTPAKPAVDSTELTKALAAARSGQATNYHAEIIAEANAVEAIPDLEKQFAHIAEPLEKAKLAQVLLVLGDKKDLYWDYLAELVKPALESDAPDPVRYNAQGKFVTGPSPEWLAWAKSHNAPAGAAENAIYGYPVFVDLIAETGDLRAVPLLQRAISSPNELLAGSAAKGLAKFQDNGSIPLIIAACERAPSDGASFIAESLLYFDDPDAQRAFDKYVPKDRATILRSEKAQANKVP